MKITIFEHEPWMEEYVRKTLHEHEVFFCADPLTEKNAEQFQQCDAVSVFVYSRVSENVINKLPNLKIISARSTGFDHIDREYASSKNIVVTNVPRYGGITVAEHTWALILNLSHKISESSKRTEVGNFSVTGLRGMDLYGKTLGIVGLGEIGRNVAVMSQGFNMKLRIFSRTHDEQFIGKFENAVYVDNVEDIFTHSDVISFHLPLTKDTHHVLNSENYHLLKQGCLVINTARGGVVETKALVKALQEKIVRGVGLDVMESEAIVKDQLFADPDQLPNEHELSEVFLNHMLRDMDNVVITPHNAFNSDESIKRLVDGDIQNILHFFNGEIDALDKV